MDAIEELLTRGVDKIYPSKEALEKVLRSGKKLRLYQGFDPTGIKLHIGHMAGLRKLRQFQDLGHHVIFLIGDGTGQAGDPSGKTRSREKYLTVDELRQNAKDYVLQSAKIVKFEGKNPAEILYNSEWLNKLTIPEFLNLAGHFTLQQLEERDIFFERKKRGEPINFRETMYPLFQGYDSVAMNVDLEIGGTDQTFNMLCGRQLVKEYLGREKYVLTIPLLTDSTGKKIGKTEDNVIALTSKPPDLYGMVMNLPDDVIIKCFEMITDLPITEIATYKKEIANGANPMVYKKKLAFHLTKMLNSEEESKKAQEYFETTYQHRQLSTDIPTVKLPVACLTLVDLLTKTELTKSRSEAKRLIGEKAIEIDGKVATNPQQMITINDGMIIRVGKHRFAKIVKN